MWTTNSSRSSWTSKQQRQNVGTDNNYNWNTRLSYYERPATYSAHRYLHHACPGEGQPTIHATWRRSAAVTLTAMVKVDYVPLPMCYSRGCRGSTYNSGGSCGPWQPIVDLWYRYRYHDGPSRDQEHGRPAAPWRNTTHVVYS
jgi:hypothetical protein